MKETIIKEIIRLARLNDGNPPGQIMFSKLTKISEHVWRGKFWSKWGDALNEAGFISNNWTEKLDRELILASILKACRHYKHFPTKSEYELLRKQEPYLPSDNAIRRHLGDQTSKVRMLKEFASTNPEWADVVGYIPEIKQQTIETGPARSRPESAKAGPDGYVYLIQSGEYYKIGRSDNIERRVKEIRIALPDKAILTHVIKTDDPTGIEAYWHHRFRSHRANGEWFKLGPPEVAAFMRRKFQ